MPAVNTETNDEIDQDAAEVLSNPIGRMMAERLGITEAEYYERLNGRNLEQFVWPQ